MKQVEWLDRKFDFSLKQNILPSVIERLEGTLVRLMFKTKGVSLKQLEFKPNGNWSVKEVIGHLADMEFLWQGMLEDILNNQEYLRFRQALQTTATTTVTHNQMDMRCLMSSFGAQRNLTIYKLKSCTELDMHKESIDRDLNQPLRIIDLFQLVAEHDDHHFVRISGLISAGA